MRLRIAVVFLLALCACREATGPVGSVSLEPNVVRVGYPQSAAVRFLWRPARALDRRHGSPFVFVHLLERTGQRSILLRTFDHQLPGVWTAGRPMDEDIDIYQSALADPLPPGRYILSLGLYDDSWGYRWPLEIGPEVAKREYSAATVEVSGPDPSAPKFSFGGAWRPIEAVSTRQVLAHRCLAGPATLSVDEIRAPGTLRLQWTTPFGFSLETTCEAGRDERVGPGRAWLGIRLSASASGGTSRCELRIDPGEPVVSTPSDRSTPTCLEVLAWRPDPAPSAGSRP